MVCIASKLYPGFRYIYFDDNCWAIISDCIIDHIWDRCISEIKYNLLCVYGIWHGLENPFEITGQLSIYERQKFVVKNKFWVYSQFCEFVALDIILGDRFCDH